MYSQMFFFFVSSWMDVCVSVIDGSYWLKCLARTRRIGGGGHDFANTLYLCTRDVCKNLQKKNRKNGRGWVGEMGWVMNDGDK